MNAIHPNPTVPQPIPPRPNSPTNWRGIARLVAVVGAATIAYFASGWIAALAVAAAGLTLVAVHGVLSGVGALAQIAAPFTLLGAQTAQAIVMRR